MQRSANGDVLVALEGGSKEDGAALELDYRVVGGRVESRVGTPAGNVVVTRRDGVLSVRAANGNFACDARAEQCR